MDKKDYLWTDNPAVSGVAVCDTDVLNDCMMHLKYNNTNGLPLFFMLTTDRALTGEEGVGWALQGSYVTMTYPDAVNMIINEYNSGVSSTYRGISCKRSTTGRYIADISKKDDVDDLYATTGVADIYLVDTANNAFYLPKTKWFTQYTTDINSLNKYNEAGLPNITGRAGTIFQSSDSITQGAFTIGTNGWDNKGSTGNSGYCFNFNASRSSAVYGKSSTVQPPSSNKFIYYKVGDVVAGATTALIDAEEYIADSLDLIDEKIDDAISTISSAANVISYSQIHGGILEAPKNIKLELTNGTLKLKSGSVIVIPDGLISGGGRKFTHYTTTSDISVSSTGSGDDSDFFVCVTSSKTGFLLSNVELSSTSTTTPSSTGIWYNPDANSLQYKGSITSNNLSFPVAICTRNTSGVITGIKKIFDNGGFVGSTFWINKDIKCLVPSGRKSDGTLNNSEYTSTSVAVITHEGSICERQIFADVTNSGLESFYVNNIFVGETAPRALRYSGFQGLWFNPYENKYYKCAATSGVPAWTEQKYVSLGVFSWSGSKITDFSMDEPVHVISTAEKRYIAHQSMPSDKYIELSAGVTGTIYTMPADGWLNVSKSTTSNGGSQYLNLSNRTTGFYSTRFSDTGVVLGNNIPVRRGDRIALTYTAKGDWNDFRFIYAEGEV